MFPNQNSVKTAGLPGFGIHNQINSSPCYDFILLAAKTRCYRSAHMTRLNKFGRQFLPPPKAVCIWLTIIISSSSSLARADDDDAAGSTNRDRRPIEELFKTDTVFPQEKGELEVELS